ncbi:carbohydrate kinase family protein [Thalassospira sp. MA62]|nr:carbohydrate kinase family protein [Thalassospira sp. MA62]
MTTSLSNILCFGAAHFDRTFQCTETFVPAASNPVKTLLHKPGGVARNIAVHLRLLGRQVGLIGAVGKDGDGDRVIGELSDLGIDVATIRRDETQHTASYMAVLDETGELALGMMDAEIYDSLLPDMFAPQLPTLSTWSWWLIDANLPIASLEWLAAHKGATKFCAATVSPSKAKRFATVLDKIDLLITNRAEAHVLTGIGINDVADAKTAIDQLRAKGIAEVVITLGATGVVSSDANGTCFWPPLPTKVVDVNGAGDAFFAGFLFTRSLENSTMDDAVSTGLALASLTAETNGTTVWDVGSDTVAQRALNAQKTSL